MEACGSAHYWARELIKLGHKVKLIAPQYVKPFVKRQKNDGGTRPWPQWGRVSAWNDAEAITIAAQRPEMRFVAPKSEQQQARAVLFRGRERLIHQRTELVNALRAVMYEYGYTVPQGGQSYQTY
jgi:transposase